MIKIFIAINYGSSSLIPNWVESIRRCTDDARIIIVDNFKDGIERNKVQNTCAKFDIELIELDNIGYGAALNFAINHSLIKYGEAELVFIAGNLDVIFTEIGEFESGKYVYIPKAFEGKRNRNPFLTLLQKRLLFLHFFTLKSMSPLVLFFVTAVLKIAGRLPSKVWAVHGSVFCFNSKIISDKKIFNPNTFLYSEELEFASYCDSVKAKRINVGMSYDHLGHVSTSKIIKNNQAFLRYWKPSFLNWRSRWH